MNQNRQLDALLLQTVAVIMHKS